MKRVLVLAPMLVATAVSAQSGSMGDIAARAAASASAAAAANAAARATLDRSYELNSLMNYNIDTHLDLASIRDEAFHSLSSLNYTLSDIGGFSSAGYGNSFGGPVAWAQNDPADSLYKMARDQFNRGDYRKAADLFKSLPQKYSSSAYVADAQYYQAFSLYRIGGTPELQEALSVLEARKPTANETRGSMRAPAAVGSGSSSSSSSTTYVTSSNLSYSFGPGSRTSDAAGLAARIASVLSTRGLSNDAAVKRALASGGNACDQDDQSVRAEALNALMQNDAETGRQMAVKILANKDECSVPLRRNAVMLVGNKHDDAAASTLIPVAKSDPSSSVRMAALDYLIRTQTDQAINAVIDISHSTEDKTVQRSAIRALTQSTNSRARAEVRNVVENNSADESLRLSVIDGFDRDKMSVDDATWLRALYSKSTSPRVKERIVSALARTGGDANNQWLLALVRNDDESLDSRTAALERVGRTMDIATLTKMYDASAQRPIRRSVMDLLAERKEPAALDKIVEVAKSGTDVEMRRHAISILSRSKDPRAATLLMSLVDH